MSGTPVETLLDKARGRLDRLTPGQARDAWAAGAVVVDIRPAAQRATHGELPGALIIERNVLEWRLDPTSEARLPIAAYDLPVIVLCQEGYASSLAAATLQELGLRKATDVTGGYAAWRAELGLSRKVGSSDSDTPGKSVTTAHFRWKVRLRFPRTNAGRRPAG